METANYSAFEIEDEALPNLREYALANSLYWVCLQDSAAQTVC